MKSVPVGHRFVVAAAAAVSVLCLLRAPSATADDRFDNVTALLQQHVNDQLIAGATARVVERGNVVCHTAVGWQDVASQKSMPEDAIFRIASMTKPVTSVAIMLLVEDGKLSLSDPVDRFIPGFRDTPVLAAGAEPSDAEPQQRPITIHDLLTHRSGLTYSFFAPQPHARLYSDAGITEGLGSSHLPLAENVRRIAELPLTQQPGGGWQYGLSTDVLGRVVEIVADQPFDEFVMARILRPLQMNDTHFVVPEEKLSRVATLYAPGDNNHIRVLDNPAFRPDAPSAYRSGGAGLYSTAADYTRFLQCLLNDGELSGVRLLQPATVREMTRNQIEDHTIAFLIHGDRFGLGFGVHTPDSRNLNGASPDTYSWGGIFHTYFWVDPRREVTAVLMTQLMPFDHLTLWQDFQRATYESLDAAEQAERAAGPQPGDVYREFSVHNSGNQDWRVTDPRARAEGARQFLPNPVLNLNVGDLDHAVRAEAVIDRWGGHLKTTRKSIRFNGAPWLIVPELDTTPPDRAEYFYSQDNPVVDIPLDMLREGINTIEGTCSARDDYNWGQWGLYSLKLRVYYDPQAVPHATGSIQLPRPETELADHPLIVIDGDENAVEAQVLAWYDGDDEDGDGISLDWHDAFHQFERGKAPPAPGVGTATGPPFRVRWDTTWVPDQNPRSVRLIARLRNVDGVWSVTESVDDLSLVREAVHVVMIRATDVPERFGVRAGREAACTFEIPKSLRERCFCEAALSLRTWHGWDGHHHPLQLNGTELAIRGNNHHYDMELLPVSVSSLNRDTNQLRIASDTEHHMLEVLWPGPALLLRYEGPADE